MSENKSERIVALADRCVQCGLCLPVCPTYALDRNEAESPRGRIAIAAALARGSVPLTDALREPLDHCLGCLNCEQVCPAQVRFGELLVETRAFIGPAARRPRAILALIKRPAWLRVVQRLAPLARRLARVGPARSAWSAAARLLGSAPPPRALSVPAAAVAARPSLALFPGCVGSVEDADAQQAAITLLAAAGYTVAVLPAFCCGALDAHGGEARADARARLRVREAWQASGADGVVSVTPGCLGQLRAALPGVAVHDPYALLAARADRLRFRALRRRIALHLPCTQRNVAHSGEELLGLLQRVPHLEVASLPPDCCGAAGSHLLEFPARAAQLRAGTLAAVATLAPEALLSSNIGCRLHLAAGLADRHAAIPTLHPLVLLAQQLDEGTPP